MTPAQLPWRLLARVVDVVIVAWLTIVVVIEIEGALFDDRTFTQLAVTSVVLAFAYEILPVAYRGATPGKAMLGLRIVRADSGFHAGLARSLLRYLILATAFTPRLFFLPLLVLAIPAVLHRDNRALHDLAAGTMVVSSR